MQGNSSIANELDRALSIRRRFSLAACALCASLSSAAAGAPSTEPKDFCRNTFRVDAPVTGRDAELIVDGQSGQVLYERNSTAERHPASLTKMMTLYLLFDALKAHRLSLRSSITISRHAASQLKVNLALSPGMTMTIDTAIKAVVVRSANDVAVAIAEAVGGTEGHFAQMMTEMARTLGMRNTFYHNASGLPDLLQVTTASDLATLARHLAYDFPQYYPYFATLNFSYHGATYYTHDNLLGRFHGTDGIKTGYTNASGFNLVSSVVRDGAHVIGVVMGGNTARQRDDEMVRLLAATFVRAKANPSLIAHGAIPWKSPDQGAAAQSASEWAPLGPPAPVISLSGPTLGRLLAKSGEIDEDMAESYIGDAAMAGSKNSNCLPRLSNGRV